MKKTLFLSAILSISLFSCNNKDNTQKEGVPAVKVITEAERLEGKLVSSENGDWYVIKDGEKWKALSEDATTDYLKSIENGQENVVKNVPAKTLEQFPTAGEILPKVEFKAISEADLLEGKVVNAENGEWYVIKDGQRWIPVSEVATNDYLKSIENGQENVIKNVPVATLEQFPISGKLLPKLEFKEEIQNKTAQ